MEKKCTNAPSAPPALGPYSHTCAAGGLLFVSGQGPFAVDGSGKITGSFEDEARATFENLKTVLTECGSSLDRVVKTTVFLKDMDRFKEFNEVYKEYFTNDYPARSCVEAARLPGDIQVEIEAVALMANDE